MLLAKNEPHPKHAIADRWLRHYSCWDDLAVLHESEAQPIEARLPLLMFVSILRLDEVLVI